MARMHSRAKGKSRSKKPVEKKLPSWVTYKGDEVELIVAKLAKEGKSPSQIGLFLRDSYGIPDARPCVVFGCQRSRRPKHFSGVRGQNL